MRTGRLVTALVLATIVVSSCGQVTRRGSETTAAPDQTGSVGEAFRTFAPAGDDGSARRTSAPAPASAIVVKLTDQNDVHPSGIPVRFAIGGKPTTIDTDRRGEARIDGPGRFRIDVLQGCHPKVRVTGGGFANVSAPIEGTKPVDLPVRWEHRFAPSPPVHAWTGEQPVGDTAPVSFSVIDRCAKKFAPGASFETFALKTNSVVELVGRAPTKADGDGRASFTLRCVREGYPSVIAVDSRNQSDSFDMVEESSGLAKPRCG